MTIVVQILRSPICSTLTVSMFVRLKNSKQIISPLKLDYHSAKPGERHKSGVYLPLPANKMLDHVLQNEYIDNVYRVIINKTAEKGMKKMPERIRHKMVVLIDDLESKGPLLYEWNNFSKLGDNNYHCHLTHKWVACWQCENDSIIIEVYYAGSRENAPY